MSKREAARKIAGVDVGDDRTSEDRGQNAIAESLIYTYPLYVQYMHYPGMRSRVAIEYD